MSEQNLISGTVTISNIGSLYREQEGYFGLLEIIPQQVFVIGLGAVQENWVFISKAMEQNPLEFEKFFLCVWFLTITPLILVH